MKKNNGPAKGVRISWILVLLGTVLALTGALISQNGNPNGLFWLGMAVILAGVVWQFVTVRCPGCGFSLVGFRPIPKECPRCHRKLEE